MFEQNQLFAYEYRPFVRFQSPFGLRVSQNGDTIEEIEALISPHLAKGSASISPSSLKLPFLRHVHQTDQNRLFQVQSSPYLLTVVPSGATLSTQQDNSLNPPMQTSTSS
jgi:hypothetical protein